MTVNQRVSGSSPEGGASESTTYSTFAVGGFLFAQQFAQLVEKFVDIEHPYDITISNLS